jgi:hypothetical protein
MRHLMCLTCLLVLVACAPAAPRAVDLLPTVPTANVVEGQTLVEYLRSFQQGIVELRTHPAETQLLKIVDDVRACYAAINGVAVRAYADKRLPLMSGVIAIVNRRDLADMTQFSGCLAQADQSLVLQPTFALCSHSYTLPRADAQYEVAYLALSQNMCAALCARLPGCTAHR